MAESQAAKSPVNSDASSQPGLSDNMISNTQQHIHPVGEEEDDDAIMYINIPPADEASDSQEDPDSISQQHENENSQYTTSDDQHLDPALRQGENQDSQYIRTGEPTENEVAAAVAAAAVAANLDRDLDEDSSRRVNNTVQQEANSAVVAAAAAAAAEAAAAAAADSSSHSDNEETQEQEQLEPTEEESHAQKDSESEIPKEALEQGDSESITQKPQSSTSSDHIYQQNVVRPWPIDKPMSEADFQHVPRALRESLVQSSDYANGLTYITQVEPQTFQSKSDAIDYLRTFGLNEGFSAAEVESESTSTCLIFVCTHHQHFEKTQLGPKRPHDEISTTPETYDPCPFRVTITLNPQSDTWFLDSPSPDHNHGPTGPAASAKRRRLTYFQKTLQDDFIPPKFALSKKKLHHPHPPIFGGHNPEEAPQSNGKKIDFLRGLVGALRFDNAYVMDRLDKNGSVTHLFWTTQDCMDMLQLFPEVLFINVVRDPKVLPLIHIVGVTCFNTTFEVGYGYIKSYLLEGLVWTLNSLKEIATKALQKPYHPSAVIIHHDLQLMGAVELEFENTCQFCVSQLTRDVNEKALSYFGTPDERKRFIDKFQKLVDSETADIYAFNEAGFKKEYQGTKILEYVTYHWLQQKTRFVRAWVDQHLHFNNYSMGKAEVAQATIENYVHECDGDVLKMYYRISSLLKRKKEDYEALLKQEQEKCPLKFFVPFFDDVRLQISTHALELIKEQHELYLEAQSVRESLSRCTSMFTNTTGLPCKHTLARPVTMDDIHPHWWLHKQKHYRVPLSVHERRSIEVASKFERTLSLAKQHFLNIISLDLRECMLAEVMKYFSGIGVSGIDEMNSPSGTAAESRASPSLNPRATPPLMSPSTAVHHHILSGSSSPISSSVRISTPTTNLHKNSVHGLITSHPLNSTLGNVGGDGSPVNTSMALSNVSSLYMSSAGNSFRGAQDYDNNNDVHTGENGSTPTGDSPVPGGADMTHGNPHISGSTHSLTTAGTTNGNGRHQSYSSSRTTAEFNELAAAAAAAAAAETGGSNSQTTSSQASYQQYRNVSNGYQQASSNNTYPASIANIMNTSNSSSTPASSAYYRQASNMSNVHQQRDALAAAQGILQVSSHLPSTPRKCGKCNQIGHNSRTCGQRISLDGL